jgi:hypothetical protein
LKIVREGKESSQGVGYLEDGTMVVINDARELIGQRRPVVVTGALQTPTGRMVFGRLETNKDSKTTSKGKSQGKTEAKTKTDQTTTQRPIDPR